MIDLGQAVGASGKYWVKVHDGNGSILRESSPGKNLLTNAFFSGMLDGSVTSGCPIVGEGNTPPAVTDTTLADYVGKCNSVEVVSGSYSYSDTPDANGYVYIRQTYVAHYLPGRLGSTPLNLSEAGIANQTISGATGSTGILSRGLLVNGSGVPTSVSYDPEVEYLDVYWELTLWFKVEVSGVVSFDILGTPTDHAYVARISNWRQQASTSNSMWQMPTINSSGINFLQSTMRINPPANTDGSGSNYVCGGALGTMAQLPVGRAARSVVSAVESIASATGSRDWKLTWAPDAGNISGGITCAFVSTGTYNGSTGYASGSSWQISFDPPIDKTSMRYFELEVRMSAGNYTP